MLSFCNKKLLYIYYFRSIECLIVRLTGLTRLCSNLRLRRLLYMGLRWGFWCMMIILVGLLHNIACLSSKFVIRNFLMFLGNRGFGNIIFRFVLVILVLRLVCEVLERELQNIIRLSAQHFARKIV